MISKDIYELVRRQYPPESVNNSRAYMFKLLHRFDKRPSDTLAHQIEYLLPDISIDWSDGDWGTGPQGSY